jgi:hypothetical protein
MTVHDLIHVDHGGLNMAGGIPTNFNIGAKVTPQTAAANYVAGAASKGTKWATNYLQSKVDPFNAAALAADYMIARINEVGAAGVRAGLARVNRAQVAKLVSTQGPTLYASGINNKGAPNYAAAAQGLIPALQQIAANLPPRGTLEQNLARAVAQARAAAALRGQYRAGM